MQTIETIELRIDFSKDSSEDGEIRLGIVDQSNDHLLRDDNPLNVLETTEAYIDLEDRDAARARLHELVDKFFDLMK